MSPENFEAVFAVFLMGEEDRRFIEALQAVGLPFRGLDPSEQDTRTDGGS